MVETQQDKDEMAVLRRVRSAEFFLLYDTICIGPTARTRDEGWFNTFADFANADQVSWFTGRSSNVGLSFANGTFPTRDWAYFIDHVAVELIPPETARSYVEQGCEAQAVPMLFASVADGLAVTLEQNQADTRIQFPLRKAPAGGGPGPTVADALGIGLYGAPPNGAPMVTNMLHLPEPIKVPKNATVKLSGRVDSPLRELLLQYTTTPGYSNFPAEPPGTFARRPNWYKIRITFFARRRLQVRGGYGAA